MVRNATMKNTVATAYTGAAKNGALFTGDPGTTGAVSTEITGGSPAYARQALSWGSASGGAATASAVTFNVASGTTVAYAGVTTSATATTADLQDSVAVTSQTFNSQGTYQVTFSYQQS